MTRYQLLLYVHLTAAIVWVGGVTMMQLFADRARRRGRRHSAAFGEDMAWIGKRVLGPASLATVGAGAGMVIDAEWWSFSDDWITIALVLFATAYVPSRFIAPAAQAAFGASPPAISPPPSASTRRLTIVSRIELAVLFLIVFDMATKPTFADHGGDGPVLRVRRGCVAILWHSRGEIVARPTPAPGPARGLSGLGAPSGLFRAKPRRFMFRSAGRGLRKGGETARRRARDGIRRPG